LLRNKPPSAAPASLRTDPPEYTTALCHRQQKNILRLAERKTGLLGWHHGEGFDPGKGKTAPGLPWPPEGLVGPGMGSDKGIYSTGPSPVASFGPMPEFYEH
jgi:hypothetical protein